MRSVCSTHLLNYHTGAELTCWCGDYAKDSVAVLVCFAMNGYHSLVQYKWYHDKREMVENTYPVLCPKETGMYECILIGTGVHKSNFFLVIGMSITNSLISYYVIDKEDDSGRLAVEVTPIPYKNASLVCEKGL